VSEQPAPMPVAPEKPKRTWLTVLLVVAGVLVVICCMLVVVYFVVVVPAVADTNLKIVCAIENTSGSSQATTEKCNAWLADLKQNHARELQQCQQAQSSNTYQCLVDKGLGPK
jgi:predicted PurR-regulated permease PerM